MLKPIEPRNNSPEEAARYKADCAHRDANPEAWGGGQYDRYMQVSAPRETETATVLALREELNQLRKTVELLKPKPKKDQPDSGGKSAAA